MNYLFLMLGSMKKQPFNFALVLIELAALFIAVNFTVSTIAERQMLIKPFAEILNKNSVFVYDAEYFDEYGKNPSGALESRQKLLCGIDGDYDCYDVATFIGKDFTIISINDEIYSRLKLPLALGNRKDAVCTFDAAIGKQTFDVGGIPLELNVNGKLTKETFLPTMGTYGSVGFTAKDFFTSDVPSNNVILTNRSSIESVADKFHTSLGFIISFKSNAEENILQLERNALTERGTDIRNNSIAALTEDLLGFIPLIVCIFIIVVIGVVSISVITYSRNEYQSGILWICGYSKSQILFSHVTNILVFLTTALGVSAIAYGALRMLGNEIARTVTLGVQNLLATLCLYFVLVAASIIIPAIKCSRTAPIEYLGRAK